jgi:hypothetical protein
MWWSSAASRIFNAFSLYAKLPHTILDINIKESLVLIMFNQLRMNLCWPMTLFPTIFDEDSLLHEYGKGRENV